jgi:hypothetical protein
VKIKDSNNAPERKKKKKKKTWSFQKLDPSIPFLKITAGIT